MVPGLPFAAVTAERRSQIPEPFLDTAFADDPEVFDSLAMVRRAVVFECVERPTWEIGACRATVQFFPGSANLDGARIAEIRPLAATAGELGQIGSSPLIGGGNRMLQVHPVLYLIRHATRTKFAVQAAVGQQIDVKWHSVICLIHHRPFSR